MNRVSPNANAQQPVARLLTLILLTAGLMVNAAPPGRVVAWGYNGNGQTNIPTGLGEVIAIAACASDLQDDFLRVHQTIAVGVYEVRAYACKNVNIREAQCQWLDLQTVNSAVICTQAIDFFKPSLEGSICANRV